MWRCAQKYVHSATFMQSSRDLESLQRGPPCAWRLAEALAFAAVGGNGAELPVLVEHVIVAEALGELAGLGVAQPDPVARPQLPGGRAADRRLNLAGALGPDEAEAGRQVRPRQPVRGAGARGNVAAGEQRGHSRP